MDKITALERELLKSVETLVNGTRQDVKSLQNGLMTERNNYEERLQIVETRLTNIERTLTKVIDPLAQHLESFQSQIEQLAKQLKKLDQ